MTHYIATFVFMGACVRIEIGHDDKSQYDLDHVCMELAKKLDMSFLYARAK